MKFRIDLKIFLFLILFYFTKQIEIYAMIMIFAIIHELGHLIAGILMGMRPDKMEVMPFGLSISFDININNYNKKIKKANFLEIKKIFVALAGPITNLLIILIASNLDLEIEKRLIIIYTNALIMLFNLLPIYPLDGGRVIKGILHIYFKRIDVERYINNIAIIATIIFTAISSILILYVQNISIFIIDMYLWYLVIKENMKYKRRINIYKKILENKMI